MGLAGLLSLVFIQASRATKRMGRISNLKHSVFLMNSLTLANNTKVIVGTLAAVVTNAFDWVHTTTIANVRVNLNVLSSSLFRHVLQK